MDRKKPCIDSHQHFWKYSEQHYSWMNDEMAHLRRDFLPPELYRHVQPAGIDATIAVQANQSEDENRFLLSLANEYDWIKGVVGWVDLQSPDVSSRLEYYSSFKKMKGFRHVIQDEPDTEFLFRPSFLKGISLLKQCDFSYDILIYHYHLANTVQFVSLFPDQRFVLDHIGKPDIRNQSIVDWKKNITQLAAYENVHCKISGMFTETKWKLWSSDDFLPYMDTIVECFGTNRIMFGSDWPVCELSVTYEEQTQVIRDYFADFTFNEQESIFGTNAIEFYHLSL